MRYLPLFLLLLISCKQPTEAVKEVSITGTWKTASGVTLLLVQDGNKLSGSYSLTGTFIKPDIQFSWTQTQRFDFSGKLTDDNTISGTRTWSNGGDSFTLTRQ